MDQPAVEPTTTTTFVVRFWREWTGAEARWRGRIEHVGSGRRADFLSIDRMLGALQEAGITIATHDAPHPNLRKEARSRTTEAQST